ncbi:LpxI family protein [Paracoccus suum]|uniref:LpxI family protein n=1 Tax=Paracoccus suum TaxID=2259340 RepID=A0A344PL51_9RHOB|nr:UDP-2,3-diacylglucosamine diphosphatase LpxI [Paracoccus suum]AXC50106.1 LpxI family protein [Paracoccus suum]
MPGTPEANRTAIIAGSGGLAAEVAAGLDAPIVAALEGFAPDGIAAETFRLERLIPFLDGLMDRGVTRVVFAGAVRRPALDPEAFDPLTARLVPRIAMAMRQGDDAALRELIAIFEDAGLAVAGLREVAPQLLPASGILAGRVTAADDADASRAAEVVATLGALDIGQGAVVAGGLTLAVETLPGTAAMLEFTAQSRSGRGGVLWKAPKPGQDLRIDLPAIGPDTIDQVAAAKLNGIAWRAGHAVLLDRERTMAAAEAAGLFLWSRPDD